MKQNHTTLVAFFSVYLLLLSGCGGGGGSSLANSQIRLLPSVGNNCRPMAINNHSEVLVTCGDHGDVSGLKIIDPTGTLRQIETDLLATPRPGLRFAGFADTGAIFLDAHFSSSEGCQSDAELCSFEIQQDGSHSTHNLSLIHVSKDGRYLCGVKGDSTPALLLLDQEIPFLHSSSGAEVTNCEAVNNSELQLTNAWTEQNSIFAVLVDGVSFTRAKDSGGNQVYGMALNNLGDSLLVEDVDQASSGGVQNQEIDFRAADGSIQVLKEGNSKESLVDLVLNDRRVVVAELWKDIAGSSNVPDATMVWTPGRGFRDLGELVPGSPVLFTIGLNDQNELLGFNPKSGAFSVIQLPE